MNYLEQLLAQNEKVVKVAHQSWVVLVREAVVDLFLALVVIGLTLVSMAVPAVVPPSLAWLPMLLLLIPAARFVIAFIYWSSREYIVTNRRVIQIEGVVNKNVIDSSLEKVNDVRMTQSVLGRLLNYGDLEILTASELGTNLFQRIAGPIGFKTAMLDEKEKLGFGEGGPGPGTMSGAMPGPGPAPQPSDIPSLIASLNALRSQGLITEEEFQKKKAELLARM